MIITPAQLRAARGLLNWTRSELAKASGLSAETIKNIEHGTYMPQDTTIGAIVKAFSKNHIEFTDHDGVRRNTETVVIYQTKAGFRQFMDEVYEAASDPDARVGGDKPICVSNVDDRLFVESLGDYASVHVARMNKLKNIKILVLTSEENYYKAESSDYIEYRWIGHGGTGAVPFYVYGNKFAILTFREGKDPRVIVISSELVADAFRAQFNVLWKKTSYARKK
ncbi:MAG: helix-turn-helix transcriptional regulator [Alphaproteobacteria bacterium]|nr:helix-turn-helix transcriptional regulator [Alphaproteobacteria bacterium]